MTGKRRISQKQVFSLQINSAFRKCFHPKNLEQGDLSAI